jgi:excinuclease UvrABC nuclease subunit
MEGTIIEYKIDNFSNIIPLDLLKECYIYCVNTHSKYRNKQHILKPNLIGCYFLYDENKNIIYIGKSTRCIRSRILYHCFTPISKYISKEELSRIEYKRKNVKYYSFSIIDKQMIDFVECGLINKYQPILNVEFINK